MHETNETDRWFLSSDYYNELQYGYWNKIHTHIHSLGTDQIRFVMRVNSTITTKNVHGGYFDWELFFLSSSSFTSFRHQWREKVPQNKIFFSIECTQHFEPLVWLRALSVDNDELDYILSHYFMERWNGTIMCVRAFCVRFLILIKIFLAQVIEYMALCAVRCGVRLCYRLATH